MPIVNPTALPYKVYLALLSQSALLDPTATVLLNTIGSIVWSYNNAGEYYGTLLGAFPLTKTWISIQSDGDYINTNPNKYFFETTVYSVDQVRVQSLNFDSSVPVITNQDNLLLRNSIEIRVFP